MWRATIRGLVKNGHRFRQVVWARAEKVPGGGLVHGGDRAASPFSWWSIFPFSQIPNYL